MAARRRPPEAKPEGDYHHGNLRQALLDAAATIVEESGPLAFTMRDAARRLKVDHRALYRHFGDRDAVLAAVAELAYRELVREMERELAGHEGAETRARLLAVGRAYVRFAVRNSGRYRLMTGPRLNEGGLYPELEAALEAGFRMLASEVKRGLERRALAPVDVTEAVLTLWAAMHGVASLVALRRIRVRGDSLSSFVDRTIGHTVRGLE